MTVLWTFRPFRVLSGLVQFLFEALTIKIRSFCVLSLLLLLFLVIFGGGRPFVVGNDFILFGKQIELLDQPPTVLEHISERVDIVFSLARGLVVG